MPGMAQHDSDVAASTAPKGNHWGFWLGTGDAIGRSMKHFELTTNDAGYASFRDGVIELTRWRRGSQWEFYAVTQRGASKGLPMFVRYLSLAEGAVLTAVLNEEAERKVANTLLAKLEARG